MRSQQDCRRLDFGKRSRQDSHKRSLRDNRQVKTAKGAAAAASDITIHSNAVELVVLPVQTMAALGDRKQITRGRQRNVLVLPEEHLRPTPSPNSVRLYMG